MFPLHRGFIVDRTGSVLNVPFDSEFECPNMPGHWAVHQTEDWRPMTEAQRLYMEATMRDSEGSPVC
jgi:hypothetical protein